MKISAVLLAGGESRRFGEDKAAFVFNGKPLWEQQVDTLKAVQPSELLVSARKDPSWRPNDIGFVQDTPPSCGPISGLLAAFSAMSGSHLLALAIDLPLMTSDWLRSLVSLTEEGRGVLPIADGKEQPLAAIYPVEAAEIFVRRAREGSDSSLKGVARELIQMGLIRELPIPQDQWRLFENMNRLPVRLD
jgi:molybdenum cofactor guanylyltransferase